jgi:alginate O-acetyltransferase complex protein AlgJ
MPKFVRKLTVFFVIPIVINLIAILLMPVNFFTFRSWETLRPYILPFSGPFYPNQMLVMIEVGDLGHNTPYANPRRVQFITDRHGYRHTEHEETDYSIVIIGDSMIAGSGISQKDILSEVLSRNLEQNVYPLAPATMQTYSNEPRFRESAPEVLILATVERNINRDIKLGLCDQIGTYRSTEQKLIKDIRSPSSQVLRIFTDQFFRNPVYLAGYISSKYIEQPLFVGDEDLLFYEPALKMSSMDDLDRIVDELVACEERFAEVGIGFVFLPIPDKENIYFDLVPFELLTTVHQPPRSAFLRSLIDKLVDADIQVVDTLSAFENARSDGLLIYQSDDTHWNVEGVRITADLTIELLNSSVYR